MFGLACFGRKTYEVVGLSFSETVRKIHDSSNLAVLQILLYDLGFKHYRLWIIQGESRHSLKFRMNAEIDFFASLVMILPVFFGAWMKGHTHSSSWKGAHAAKVAILPDASAFHCVCISDVSISLERLVASLSWSAPLGLCDVVDPLSHTGRGSGQILWSPLVGWLYDLKPFDLDANNDLPLLSFLP